MKNQNVMNRYVNCWTGALVVLVGLFFSCGNMDDTYKEFLVGGERIFAGRVLNVRTVSGNEKVTVIWQMPADPNITEFRIYWNSRLDSVVYPIKQDAVSDGIFELEIKPLVPATYYFEILSFDGRGRSSVKTEFAGIAYPEGYEIGN